MSPIKMEMPFPRDIDAHITTTHCYRPTPSAKAINAYFDMYPWLVPMMIEFPHVHPIRIIGGAQTLGHRDCHKCSHCCLAKLFRIRHASILEE